VAPRVVRAVVGSADGAAHVPPHPRRTARPRTAVAAGDAAGRARAQLSEARLPVAAPHAAARRQL
jgi:hypothetical protein